MKSKVVASPREAVSDVRAGMTVMIGGFSQTVSWPSSLIHALADHGTGDLTVIANSMSHGRFTPQLLADRRLVKRFIGSGAGQVGRPTAFEDQFLAGEVEVEMVPQGTFVERIRAAGAGIAAFYTPTAAETDLAQGKELRQFNGRPYLLATALSADFALLRANVVDEVGNCRFEGPLRNFQTAMATAAETVIVEADRIVPAGHLDPEAVHLPGIFVDRVVTADLPRDEIVAEGRGYRRNPSGGGAPIPGISRDQMGLRAARMIADYKYVNLGVGLPTLVGRWLERIDASVMLQGENGILGYHSLADLDRWNPNIFDAGSLPVEYIPGSAIFDSATSFTMIRGGHLDAVVLGGYQVSQDGDLANWVRPNVGAPGVGGAMDLVAGGIELIVVMEHTTRDGRPRLVEACTLPVTGRRCVRTVVTNLAVIDVTPDGLRLREIAPGVTGDQVLAATGCPLTVPSHPPTMDV